jgi:hypothetical protein
MLRLHDQFAQANGTDIGSTFPRTVNRLGKTWTQSGANTLEHDGSGKLKSATAGAYARIDLGSLDQDVTVTWNRGGANNKFLFFLRSNDVALFSGTNDCYWIYVNTTGPVVELFRMLNGASTSLGTYVPTLATNTDYVLRCTVIGNDLNVYEDGVLKIGPITETGGNVIDGATKGGTWIGLSHDSRADGTARISNFKGDDTLADDGVPHITARYADTGAIYLECDANLDEASVPATTDFTSSVKSLNSMDVSGSLTTIGVTVPFGTGDSGGTLTYVIGSNPLQAASDGDDVAAFSAIPIENRTLDVTAPTVSSRTCNHDEITITCSESLDEGSVPAFSVWTHSTKTIIGHAILGSVITLKVSVPFGVGDSAGTLAYTSAGNPIQDSSSNALANFGATAITNTTALPTIVITTVTSSIARVAPAPIFFDCNSASTIGAGRWKDATCRWRVTSDTVGAFTLSDLTHPDSGTVYAWDAGSGEAAIQGFNIGICVRNVAATITVECRVDNAGGEYDDATAVTVSSTGSPDVSYSVRPDAGYHLVDPAHGGAEGAGAGTYASPKTYTTWALAAAAISGNNQTIFFKDNTSPVIAGSESLSGHLNLWIGAQPGYSVKPNLTVTSGSNITVIGARENCVIENLTFTPNQLYSGTPGADAIEVVSNNVWIENCTDASSSAGNAFRRFVSATNWITGLGIYKCVEGNNTAIGLYIACNNVFIAGCTFGMNKDNYCMRVVGKNGGASAGDTTTPTDGTTYITTLCCEGNGDDGTGTIRYQFVQYGAIIGCWLHGGVVHLGFSGHNTDELLLDQSLCANIVTDAAGAVSIFGNTNHVKIRSTIMETFNTISVLRSQTTADATVDCLDWSVVNNTLLMRTAAGGGNGFDMRQFMNGSGTDQNYVVSGIEVRNNVFGSTAAWAAAQREVLTVTTGTQKRTIDAFADNIIQGVGNVALVDGVDLALAAFQALSWESGTQVEVVESEALATANYIPNGTDHPLTIAGHAVRNDCILDYYGATRAATTAFGAVDPSGTLDGFPGGGGGGGGGAGLPSSGPRLAGLRHLRHLGRRF